MGDNERRHVADGLRLILDAASVLTYLAGARVPMPRTTREFLERCDRYIATGYAY